MKSLQAPGWRTGTARLLCPGERSPSGATTAAPPSSVRVRPTHFTPARSLLSNGLAVAFYLPLWIYSSHLLRPQIKSGLICESVYTFLWNFVVAVFFLSLCKQEKKRFMTSGGSVCMFVSVSALRSCLSVRLFFTCLISIVLFVCLFLCLCCCFCMYPCQMAARRKTSLARLEAETGARERAPTLSSKTSVAATPWSRR